MAGYTQAYQQTLLNYVHPTSGNNDHVAYSTNGTSEWAGMARTAVGATGWASATNATPSLKSNNTALTSSAATAAGTVTHTAIFSASTAGTQKTDWQAVTASKAVAIGDTLTIAVGDLTISLD